MARKLLKDTCELAAEILDGQHDDDLDFIVQAARARLKNRFRPGMKVRLVGTKNPTLDGQIGTVSKVNQKTVVVVVGGEPMTDAQFAALPLDEMDKRLQSVREYNVPPTMLETL